MAARRAVKVRQHARRVKSGGHTTVKKHARTISPEVRSAYQFFRGKTGAVGRDAEAALQLAKAERYGAKHGWTVEWEHDPEPYETDDDSVPNEVLGAVLKNEHGKVLGSLWGIGDPSRDYRRIVEAELMSEAMP